MGEPSSFRQKVPILPRCASEPDGEGGISSDHGKPIPLPILVGSMPGGHWRANNARLFSGQCRAMECSMAGPGFMAQRKLGTPFLSRSPFSPPLLPQKLPQIESKVQKGDFYVLS